MTSDTTPDLPLDATASADAPRAKTETAPFDPAAHLKTPQEIADFLESAFEDGDAATVRHAIGVAARAHGMAQIAREAGLGRESLYKALSETGNPSLETIRAVLKALGLALTVKPVETDAA